MVDKEEELAWWKLWTGVRDKTEKVTLESLPNLSWKLISSKDITYDWKKKKLTLETLEELNLQEHNLCMRVSSKSKSVKG